MRSFEFVGSQTTPSGVLLNRYALAGPLVVTQAT